MKKSYYIFLIPALIIFILTSYYSSFFHHYDEHYQIVEFAEYINGDNQPENLAWEYSAQIRPSLQPYFAAYIFSFLDDLGITNHFIQTNFLRVLSSLFLFFSLVILFRTLEKDFKSKKIKWIFLVSTFLLYFIPFISVRFSSETWSSAFFIIGFCTLYKQLFSNKAIDKKKIFFAGLFFGISFLFRYQSAILILGVAIYLIIYRIKDLKSWIIMFSAFILIFVFGVLLDKSFYNEWTISSYNYFTTTLIKNDVPTFGSSPWYWYMQAFIGKDLSAVLNTFIFICMLIFFIVKRNHVLTFSTLVFMLIHFGIGHKEMRFLFPIAFFIPYFISSSIAFFKENIKQKALIISSKILIVCLFIINLGFQFSFSFVPAYTPFTVFEMMQPYKSKPAKIYYFDWRFSSLDISTKGIGPNYYFNKKHIRISVTEKYLDALLHSTITNDTLIFAVLSDENKEWKPYFELVGKPTKNWVNAINKDNFWKLNMVDWGLYKLKDEYVRKNN